MRGKPLNIVNGNIKSRITPADAGKTRRESNFHFGYWDHPRGCGENFSDSFADNSEEGSPPRMRGKPKVCKDYKPFNGITPADAGKTRQDDELREKEIGSPPRMRGKLG